jgi:hypothetical protein
MLSSNVSDETLARVPPIRLGEVNAGRTEVARADDELAWRNLAVHQARNELELAKKELEIARFNLARAHGRAARGEKGAASELDASRHELRIAEEHERAAEAGLTAATAERDLAQSKLELANARLEWRKFQAVVASGDPAVKELDGDTIRRNIQAALVAVGVQATKVVTARSDAEAAHRSWSTAQREAATGLGGSGSTASATEHH